MTATLVTLAEPIVPDAVETAQVCPDGLVFTVTAYAAPDANLVANVNGPFALTLRSSPPLSCNTTVPDNPDTDPPTEIRRRRRTGNGDVGDVGRADRALTPFETEQVWPDGFVFTVTAYAAPDANLVANVNGPFALTLRSSPPLSCNTTVPDNPDTDPPTEYVGPVGLIGVVWSVWIWVAVRAVL